MKADYLLIDDFEENNIENYEEDHTYVTSYQLSISTAHAKEGKRSLALTYDFSGWFHGNGAMYIRFIQAKPSYRRPKTLGLWVRADGHSPWLRATLLDGTGMKKVVNLTNGTMDWRGWKYVEAPLHHTWPLPIILDQIYAVETDKRWRQEGTYQGVFHLDAIRYVYRDDRDMTGPVFNHTYPEKKDSLLYSDTFTFSTNITDEQSGVDPGSIQVFANNEQLEHDFCMETGFVSYPFRELDAGILHVVVKASDNAGNPALPDLERNIQIDLSPDIDPPVLSDLSIRENMTISIDRPRITFRLVDEKSGVDAEAIDVYVNQTRLKVNYDPHAGWCYSYPADSLKEGAQTLTLAASDRSGNAMQAIHLTFYYQQLVLPMDSLKLAIIPDTHTIEAFSFLYNRVQWQYPDLIIHMGDMVDQATVEEFESFQQIKDIRVVSPFFALAGNHEAFQGDLDLFHYYFGAGAYHVQLHHTLFIVLNSAYDQSITKSDTTQFDYLCELLDHYTPSSMVVATHVPIADTFGTAHEMEADDGKRLHQILSSYKQRKQHVDITVLFGHLHVFQSWWQDDIQYVVVGNGSQKGYTSHNNGNMLGFSQLEITKEETRLQFIPLLTKIYVESENHSPVQIGTNDNYSLTVYGLFQEVAPYYTVDLTWYNDIPLTWSSSDPTIVTVSPRGEIRGQHQGVAMITVTLEGIEADVEVEVV